MLTIYSIMDLYNADCLEKMKDIHDSSIDIIISDLPYGKFKNLVDSGIIDIYTGPTDYKTYLKNFADGGSVDLTIISMPDISGSGVESLFKTR